MKAILKMVNRMEKGGFYILFLPISIMVNGKKGKKMEKELRKYRMVFMKGNLKMM